MVYGSVQGQVKNRSFGMWTFHRLPVADGGIDSTRCDGELTEVLQY